MNGSNNTIGGTAAGQGNTLSGNRGGALGDTGSGISMVQGSGNVALGNRIGTDPQGLTAVPNRYGVNIIAASGDAGTTPGTCPDVGVNEAISGHKWGDVNCDGLVNVLDALYVLVFKAQLHTLPSPLQNCFPIGSVIT